MVVLTPVCYMSLVKLVFTLWYLCYRFICSKVIYMDIILLFFVILYVVICMFMYCMFISCTHGIVCVSVLRVVVCMYV